MSDSDRKGRGHKLDEKDMKKLRTMIVHGYSNGAIADTFGISTRMVRYIRSGRYWREEDGSDRRSSP